MSLGGKTGFALALTLVAGLSACAPTISQRGYFADPTRTQAISVGVDTKQTISDRLGTPTLRSSFNTDTWFYVSATQEQVIWYEPWTTKEDIIEVTFDDDDRVKDVKRYNEADMHRVDPVRAVTPTRGRELSFWEQMFGNIGRQPLGGAGQGNQGPGQGPGGGY
jgi:outer membrane protein assembly factor BamE (lipoprotein component of BamABCDE complex)